MKKYKYEKYFRYNGKKYVVRGDTEKEVTKKLILKQHDLETGHVIVNGDMRVSDWAKRCFDTYKANAKEETVHNQWLTVKKHILPYIGDYSLKDVKPIQCQEILNAMTGYSWSSIKNIQTQLHFIFEKALQNKMVFENPAENLIRPKAVKGRRRTITSIERKHFLKIAAENDRYIFFLFMLKCGCRPEEVAELRGSDIKKQNGVWLLHIRGTKTENSDRWVPLPAALRKRIGDRKPFELLCPNCSGHKHTKSSYNRLVACLKRDMNISMGVEVYRSKLVPPLRLAPDFVPYDFRHTYCTDLQRAGIDIRTAQKLMGHANISITADIYTHIGDDQIEDAAHVLGADDEEDSDIAE